MRKIILLSILSILFSKISFSQTYNIATENGNTINTCTGIFVDNGGAGGTSNNNGAGNYGNNLNQSVTFCPENPGDVIKLTFTLFNIKETTGQNRSCEDFLYVYQSNQITATPDDIYCGDLQGALLPVIFSTSPDGCVTFQFISDGNGNRAGWAANISCVTPCQNPIANLTDLSDISICPDGAENPGSMTINVDASNSLVGNYAVAGSQQVINYDWEWGDGAFETTNNPITTHTYSEPGIYVVKLRVRDDNTDFSSAGCVSNNSLTRVVRVLPTPSFTGSSNSPIDVNCGDDVTITTVATSQTTTQDLPSTETGNITLPDGNGQSYESGANYSGLFPDGATLSAGCYPTVNFNMEHSWSRDLTIDLIAPNGQAVRLFNRHGIPGTNQASYKFGTCVNGADNGVPGCGANYTVINNGGNSWTNYGTTAAQVGTTATTVCGAWPTGTGVCETGTYYKSGIYNSSTSFATIEGAPLNGTWTLRITDNQSLDDGTLFSWSLIFPSNCYGSLESVTPDITSVTWSHSGDGPVIPAENPNTVAVIDPGPDACPTPGTCTGTSITNTIELLNIGGSGQLDYEALVVDEFGCQYINVVSLNVICDLNATISGATTFCGNGSTDLTFSGTPNAEITYNINGGANLTILLDGTGTAILNTGNLTATTNYNLVSVTNGIITVNLNETETITINALPTVSSVNGGNTYCQGDVINNVTATVTGVSSWTIDYTLDGVAQTTSGASSPISLGNTAGEYIVTNVTDANCTNAANGTQTITINNPPIFSLSSNEPSACNGNDGFFVISNLNANEAYTITYDDDGVTVGPIAINSDASGEITISNLNAGVYSNVVVSLNFCPNTNVTGVTILNPGAPLINDIANQTICLPNTFPLPIITGTGLTGNEAYFDGANGTGNQFNAGDEISSNITLFIYDANGACAAQENFTITFNNQPTVSDLSGGNTYCQGDVISNISASVTGDGPWTIDYTLDGVNQSVSNATSPISLGNTEGVYILTGISDANCSNTASQTQTITINTQPTVSSFTGGNSYCPGDVIPDLTAEVTGSSPWTIDYTLDGVAQTVSNATSPISLGNAEGVYVLTGVSDANCSNTANQTQTIAINVIPSVTDLTGGNTYCQGDIIFDISATVSGTGPWTIDYTLDGVAQSVSNATSPINLGNTAGVYVLTSVSDANCSNTANQTQTITINAQPTVSSFTGGNSYCPGDVISDLSVEVTGSSPWTLDYTLDGVAQSVSSATSPISLGNAEGVYVLTNLSDALCSDVVSGTQTIAINAVPVVNSFTGEGTYCVGETVNNLNVAVVGTGPFTITFTLNGNIQTANGTSTPISLGNTAGTYVLTSISDANCSNTANQTQTIVVNSLPTVNAGNDITVCENESVTLSGTGATSYSWNNGIDNGVAFNATSTLTYTVTGTDVNNCQNTDQVLVTVIPLPSVSSISGGSTYCAGDVISNINVIANSTGSFTISYSLNGSPLTVTGNSPISLGNTEGVYVLTSISSGTCLNTATGTQTIIVNPIPAAPNVSSDSSYCENETKSDILATALAGGSITWYSDATLSNQIGTGNSITPSSNIGNTSYYAVQTINGCESSPSLVNILVNVCNLIIPTAFTPDEDGVNDTWEIENLNEFYPNCNVKIYNRWGNLVFESNGYKDEWKGDFKGENLPVASYYYIIDFNDGKTEIANGTVSIIKNNK
jgi:gliding motility-associated-like protein